MGEPRPQAGRFPDPFPPHPPTPSGGCAACAGFALAGHGALRAGVDDGLRPPWAQTGHRLGTGKNPAPNLHPACTHFAHPYPWPPASQSPEEASTVGHYLIWLRHDLTG